LTKPSKSWTTTRLLLWRCWKTTKARCSTREQENHPGCSDNHGIVRSEWIPLQKGTLNAVLPAGIRHLLFGRTHICVPSSVKTDVETNRWIHARTNQLVESLITIKHSHPPSPTSEPLRFIQKRRDRG
jgi:hypothetical protein